jgi:flagellar FliJ protein
MRRFRFNLDPVLRLRRRLEEQAQIDLAERRRALEREKSEEERARSALQRFHLHRAGLQRHAVDVGALREADRYAEALAHALLLRQRRVQRAAAGVEAGLEALQRRRVERETLERLRVRRLTEHGADEQRAEQQTLDEAAVLRWRRQ